LGNCLNFTLGNLFALAGHAGVIGVAPGIGGIIIDGGIRDL
jgi:hypothetical protein